MKMARVSITSVCILLACLLFIGVPIGCAQNRTAEPTPEPTAEPTPASTITTGVHESNADYRAYFTTHAVTVGDLTVHLEDRIFSEDKLYFLAETIGADLALVRERMGKETGPVTVYVVGSTLKKRPEAYGNEAICSVEDVESGAYRDALVGAAFEIEIPWKQIGLSQYVFGTVDESGLKTFYEDEAHALTASCADVYLSPISADEQTVSIARQTAASITAFVIGTEGLDAFFDMTDTAEALPDWSAHLGLETAPTLPEGSERAVLMRIGSNESYLFEAKVGTVTCQVLKDSFGETPDAFYRFVCDFYYGADVVLDQIRSEIPSYAGYAEERFRSPLTIKIVDPTRLANLYSNGNGIVIMSEDVVWHELVHYLLKEYKYDVWFDWICEGIAEYFSTRAMSTAQPYTLEEAFSFDPEELTEEQRTYVALLRKVYDAVSERDPGRREGYFSEFAYYNALTVGFRLYPEDVWIGRRYEETVGGVQQQKVWDKGSDGSALTYAEAMSLVDYAFNTYGAETFMDGYMHGIPLEETIGKTYAELYRDFEAYVQETYGYLVSDEND